MGSSKCFGEDAIKPRAFPTILSNVSSNCLTFYIEVLTVTLLKIISKLPQMDPVPVNATRLDLSPLVLGFCLQFCAPFSVMRQSLDIYSSPSSSNP